MHSRARFLAAAAPPGRVFAAVTVAAVACLTAGCAGHHGERYAYAPPYAPPVYPQPPLAALPSAPPQVSVPGAAAMPGAVVAGTAAGVTTAEGVVVPAGSPCPPCAAGSVGQASYVDGGGQTPPCPPGP